MTNLWLGVVAVCGAVTVYLALFISAASPLVMLAYLVTSVVALVASWVAKPMVVWIKWGWVLVSFVMIYAVVTGPLDYLRLP